MQQEQQQQQQQHDQQAERILKTPYQLSVSAAPVRRQFASRIGQCFEPRTSNYPYHANRAAILKAAKHLGFECRKLTEVLPLPESRPGGDQQQQQQQQQQQDKNCKKTLAASRLAQLVKAMRSDGRLYLFFARPPGFALQTLGNSLVYIPVCYMACFLFGKMKMMQVLRRAATMRGLQFTTGRGQKFNFQNFTQYTTSLCSSNLEAALRQLDENPGVYILKRCRGSQGVGAKLYRAQTPNTIQQLKQCVGPSNKISMYILQKYIERPLIVDRRKFDLRVYLLIVSCKSSSSSSSSSDGYFAFVHPGYVKLSCKPYSLANTGDRAMHLTNQFVQKQEPIYKRVMEATSWLPDELANYLARRGQTGADWCSGSLYPQIRGVTGYIAAIIRSHLRSRQSLPNVFYVFGPDFIVDEQLQVKLLEVNYHPSYAQNTEALHTSISSMWSEAVCLSSETVLHYHSGQQLTADNQLKSASNFRLVFSSQSPNYLQDLISRHW